MNSATIGGKISDLHIITKTRDKAALTFNAGLKKINSIAELKTIADFGNIGGITQIMIIIMGFLFFIIFLWSYSKLSLDAQNCKTISEVYTGFPLIRSITSTNPNYQYKLRDYYIKTAYNCCASGGLKNDFVNLCALKNCIKQGARCLDFEIYSLNNKPVIAISSKVDYNVKGSYNSVPFFDAMTVIESYAFSGNTCPNPNDPLILHFRILSNNAAIYDEMSMILYDTLSERLLGKKFSYESDGHNLGGYGPLSKLMGQVIIMVDKANPLFTNTKLYEYVNIASNSVFLRNMRYTDVINCPNAADLLFYNKQNMTITLPDQSSKNNNYSADLVMTYGCQMVGMSFQNFDAYMARYTQMFDEAGSAFIFRNDRYRYIPINIQRPAAQNPDYSFASRSTPLVPGIAPLSF
jgi:hypothetical protein